MNFVIMLVKFKREYVKYVEVEYPLSTIRSKKFTDLTVQAISDKENNIRIKDLINSIVM